jgi:hypothetical protein
MIRRGWKLSAGCLLVAAVLALAPSVQAQVAVVSIRSVDGLLSDIRYVLTLAGQEDKAKQLDGLIDALTGGKGLLGVDTKKPLGAYLNMPALGDRPPVIGYIPITRDKDFLDLLKQLNCQTKKGDGDIYELSQPISEQKFYLRFANQHVYVSDAAARLEGKLADPATFLSNANRDNTVTAQVRLDQIPKEYKQLLQQLIEMELAKNQEKKPDESNAEHQGRLAGMKMARDAIVELIEQGQDVRLSLNVDQKNHAISAELSLSAKSGSTLASRFDGFSSTQSVFSGLAKDSAANVLVYLPLAKELQTQIGKAWDSNLQEAIKAEKDPVVRAQIQKIIDVLEPTIKSDSLDFAIALRGPLADKKYVPVFGLRVKQGRKLEQLLREVARDPKIADKAVIKLEHDKAKDGTAIHLVQPKEPAPDEVKQRLGTTDIYVAVREDVAVVTLGSNGLAVIKETIDTLGKAPPGTAPLQVDVALSKLVPLADQDDDKVQKVMEAVNKVFAGPDKGKDQIRLSLKGGSATLRLRLEMNAEIVKLAPHLVPLFNQ